MSSKKMLLTELCLKQRSNNNNNNNNDKYHLTINDLTRFLKYVNVSIFNNDECILWPGYLTKCNKNKSYYINYYLNGRKLALHRILYINFIDDLNENQYLKYTCSNPGKCCNIKHFYKVDDKNTDTDTGNIVPVSINNQPINNIIIRKLVDPLSPKRRIIIVFKD